MTAAMKTASALARYRGAIFRQAIRIRLGLERMPYSTLTIPLRLALATVFWNSAMVKLDNWDTALSLFTDEYALPLLPPALAASITLGIELTTPVLLVLGLMTRLAALVLLGMTGVIEAFVYPLAWPTHIQWVAMLLILLFRGPGSFSLDHVLWKRLAPAAGVQNPR